MDKYAIIKSGNKQYLVEEGQTVLVDKIAVEENKPVQFDQVLLVKDKNKVEVGTPIAAGMVNGTVLNQMQGKKLYVSKFKAKTGYRRRIGFRSQLTRVKINEISLGKAKKEKE